MFESRENGLQSQLWTLNAGITEAGVLALLLLTR